ncbi:GntR family transcriptional regulator [Nonomuraea basaltis]|uniref:GntR family transcriptional regulator n=1 Tax=Nonomuraea basaltis TaxID=2495887 RepID=UPI00110C4068|nr:GntR family transcriptional regulator [Nonomuraea basaltis]TMR90611.1 GntR family transcriptional regulator [Nonomuraea basaltis]
MPARTVRYPEIADDLRVKILDGTYPPGTYLPSAKELMVRYVIGSRTTLDNVYKTLTAEGLIRRVPRYGMLVLDPTPPVVDLILYNPHGHGPLPWSECCKIAGVEGRMVTNGITSKGADEEVAALLGIDAHTAVVVRGRTATIGDTPVRLDEAIYPRDLVEGTPIATDHKVPGGIYATLAQAGHAPAAVARRTVGARLSTDDEAKRLKLAAGAYVLTADQVIADERGRAVELLRIVANPNRVRFVEQELAL